MTGTKQTPLDDKDFLDTLTETFKLIGASWEAFKLNFWTLAMLVLMPIMLILIIIAVSITPLIFNWDNGIYAIVVAVIAAIAVAIIACLFLPAMTIIQLESVRGNKVGFKEVFAQSKKLALPYLGLAILVGLTVIFGLVLLILPGILAAFMLSMAMYLMVDKKLSVIESYKQSIVLVKNNILIVLALFIVNIGVSAVSYVPLIGWLISIVLSIAYLYLPAIIYMKIAKE